jgi:hypothetical protein
VTIDENSCVAEDGRVKVTFDHVETFSLTRDDSGAEIDSGNVSGINTKTFDGLYDGDYTLTEPHRMVTRPTPPLVLTVIQNRPQIQNQILVLAASSVSTMTASWSSTLQTALIFTRWKIQRVETPS